MRIQRGLDIAEAADGYQVVSLHYTADPEKDTPEWLAQALRGYKGGQSNPYFRKEYELDFEAISGQLIYADLWRDEIHAINPFRIPDDLNKYRIIDPGFRNPLCCLWVAVNYDDPLGFLKQFPPGAHFVYREHYIKGKLIPWHRKEIKSLTAKEVIKYTLIDPRAADKTIKGEESVLDDFRDNSEDNGIKNLRVANNTVWDGILKERALLYWEKNEAGVLTRKPKLYVFRTCSNLIREYKFYCWEDYRSEATRDRRDPKESPRKKDDHGMDCRRYFANEKVGPTRRKPIVMPEFRDIRRERMY